MERNSDVVFKVLQLFCLLIKRLLYICLYPSDESEVKQIILQLDDKFSCCIDNSSNVLVKVTEPITTSYVS